MPILKQLVPSSSQSKRRPRAELTADMISAPLGDFRHTMHVGRGGDAFGDTSFLSSRSGEPLVDGSSRPRSPRPSLLARTFRGGKRSQLVTRPDGRNGSLAPVGTASLPQLSEEDGGSRMPKSLSSNGAGVAGASWAMDPDPELEERRFGELMELPAPGPPRMGGGMKHAVSVMSFHVDLGPSMLGDVLDIMQRDEDDLGFEEGRSSEGRASPLLVTLGDEVAEEEQQPPLLTPGSVDLEKHSSGPYSPEPQPRHQPRHQPYLDSCSVSSSGSAALEEKPLHPPPGGDTDSANFSSTAGADETFCFMEEEEDDEIRL